MNESQPNEQMNRRRRKLFANKMHRDLFILVFLASLIPTAVTAFTIFYLIFTITAEQMAFPDQIAYNLFPAAKRVVLILSIFTPVVLLAFLVFAYELTHRAVGPFDRILREMDECLAGQRKGPIRLRSKDKFTPLVDRINLLIAKVQSVAH